MISTQTRPNTREACAFLSQFAVELFGCGATCIRLERNVHRIARAIGMRCEFSILPRHIHITLEAPHGDAATEVVAIHDLPISFAKIALLSKLSWQMADCHLDFYCARRTFERIRKTRSVYPALLILLVAIANASFCRLFHGDLIAMSLVFVSTAVGFGLKLFMSGRKIDFRITVIACAFISALIACIGFHLPLGTAPQIAVGTSVLYLVPGIPFINSFCDMMDRHYLCALGRAINAAVICCCLSLGLIFAMFLMHVNMF